MLFLNLFHLQVQLERLGKPYSNCTNITSTNWQPLFPGYKYSRTVSTGYLSRILADGTVGSWQVPGACLARPRCSGLLTERVYVFKLSSNYENRWIFPPGLVAFFHSALNFLYNLYFQYRHAFVGAWQRKCYVRVSVWMRTSLSERGSALLLT